MKTKALLINVAVLVVSIGVGLMLAEFVARLFLNPADFLRLEVVSDPILGAVPSASSRAAFDKWGFRNKEVPKAADIVAVGDSHTYGNTARMVDAWPYVLGQLVHRDVYNMGLGGYGPNQYFYLSKTKALSLHPKMIIWGLYMGDDFENAFSLTYGLDYWSYLRQLPPQKVEANIWEQDSPGPVSDQKKLRVWLSRHSLIYQLAFHTGIGDRLKGDIQIKHAAELFPGTDTALILPDQHIAEAFRPKAVLFGLNQEDPHVREGMRITFELIKQMNQICQQNHIQFVVVVIPIKEMVFSDLLEHNPKLPLNDVLDKLLPDAYSAQAQTFKFLGDQQIPYVDPLPALKAAREQGLYALSSGDMHPGKNGYHVIAQAVASRLKELDAANSASVPQGGAVNINN